MGKATRWLKGLLGKIRSSSDPPPSASPKDKKRWSFLKSSFPPSNPNFRRPGSASSLRFPENVPNDVASKHHAIAIAAASAAAADAAVIAAQAAADVVRLASHPPAVPAHVSFGSVLEAWAALVIQSHFRGYLARRALRALRGLVKLQALVRGHILRKKTAETMRSIQAMLRAQERARSIRAYESPNSSEKSSQTYHRGPPTPEKFEQISYIKNTKSTQSAIPKTSGSRMISRVLIHPDQMYRNFEDYYTRPDKILEMDTGKPPLINPKRRKNMFESISQLEFALDQTVYPYKRSTQEEEEEIAFCTAENSPQCCYSASSRGGLSSRKQSPMTPTKSDASATSCVSSYSDCPSYMAYTESSRAKMRSLSAPRQRPQQGIQHCQDKMSSTKRLSVYQQRVASSNATQACFANKAYAGSGRLDRLGVPSRNNATTVYYSGCLE